MGKILSSLALCLILLSSCAEQYNIAGNSSVSCLDGRMLYLKVSSGEDKTYCLDSCEVIHGRFNFMGMMDSIMMAELYMDNEIVMPLVLENANLTVKVDNISQRVTGSPLNDRLYKFFQKKNGLENEIWELEQSGVTMMRQGVPAGEIRKRLAPKAAKLSHKIEKLETNFIMENYDNVLGPGMFIMLCNQYPYPVMTSQISKIVESAPVSFMSHPFVKRYVRTAEENMKRIRLNSHQ